MALALFPFLAVAQPPASRRALADSFHQKLEHIQKNAAEKRPSTTPTILREDEVNAYFAERRLKIPEGVESVRFELHADEVIGYTTVDFEKFRKGKPDSDPLLAIFDGVHDCEVTARADQSANGKVRVSIEKVKLDGVRIPKIVLEMFIERFVNPKFPKVGLDRTYDLPARIDKATIEEHQGRIVQR